MTKILTAVFDGTVFRPDERLDLAPNTRCTVTLEVPSPATGGGAWDVLDGATGSIEAPPDWSAQHDHYIYGTPKHK